MLENVLIFIVLGFAVLALWFFASLKLLGNAKFQGQKENICKYLYIFFSLILLISLFIRGLRLERFPIANLYETFILFAFCLSCIYSYLVLKYKWYFLNNLILLSLIGLIGFALFLPESQKSGDTPLIPALNSYWRIIHIPPLITSYSFFAIASLCGGIYLFEDSKKDKIQNKLNFYSEIIFRCISFGFPLLSVGIVTGAIWANEAWGHLWQWDPKENFVLMTWILYAIYLHLKINNKANDRTLAILSIIGLFSVYLTYLGINQLNLNGKHIYGKI